MRNRKADRLKATTPAQRRIPAPLLAAAAALLLAAAAALTLLRPAPGSADPAIDCFEQDFLTLLNQYRAENGRSPLQLSAQLSAAADWMGTDLGANDYFSHIDSLGRDPGQRARDYGYYGGVGENLAAGMPLSSAQAVFDAWKSSPGHNANMLASTYLVIGIGRASVSGSPYGIYWTTDFGQSANPIDSPPPAIICGGGATPTPTQQPTPRPTPTPTVVPTPTQAPTPTPTPTDVMPTPAPTYTPQPPTPTGAPVVFGDMDCDGTVGSDDALKLLRLVAAIGPETPCNRSSDVNCDGATSAVDALEILLFVVSAPYTPSPGCPPIGTPG